MNSAVERAVAALDEELGDCVGVMFSEHGTPHGQTYDEAKADYVRAGVIAVLRAMREPSQAMADAANVKCGPMIVRGVRDKAAEFNRVERFLFRMRPPTGPSDAELHDAFMKAAWTAMIDAALSETATTTSAA